MVSIKHSSPLRLGLLLLFLLGQPIKHCLASATPSHAGVNTWQTIKYGGVIMINYRKLTVRHQRRSRAIDLAPFSRCSTDISGIFINVWSK